MMRKKEGLTGLSMVAMALWAASVGLADQPHTPVANSGVESQDLGIANAPEAETVEDSRLVAESFEGRGIESVEEVKGFEALNDPAEMTEAEYNEFLDLPTIESLILSGPETICGQDQRVQITATSAFPWRVHCQLIITLQDGRRARGTGFLIGPATLATAGHVVHGGGSGGAWMKSIQVIPGMNGRAMPFGSFVSTDFQSVQGWVRDRNPDFDYGAIKLPQRIGDRVGFLGFAALTDNDLNGLLVNLSGYPGDKQFGTQWFMADQITGVEPRRLAYMVDTFAGQSGSAVYRFLPGTGQRHAVGVHGYGGCPNKAARITLPVFNNYFRWARTD